jgi:hypothetical protein
VLLGLGSGCKSKTDAQAAGTITISGKVTYLRAPLLKGSDGVPTGIETDPAKFTSAPARGVKVRVFQGRDQLNADGVTKTTAWVLVGNSYTDSTGAYSFTTIPSGYLTFVELYSAWQQDGGHGSTVQVVADAAGIDSKLPIVNRPLYCMRKGADGTTSNTSATPGTMASVSSTVDFAVGSNDKWLISSIGWAYPTTGPFPYPPTLAVGSKPLAILDSCYIFSVGVGDPTPNVAAGSMDLHYYPGVTHPRGTFVEYNLLTYPLSFDGNTYRFSGSIASGAPFADDAYNEGILFPIMARNYMYGQSLVSLPPVNAALPSMAADLALVEGFPDAIAASVLQSPYLADPARPTRFPARDIRDISGLSADQINVHSAPFIRALTWQFVLTASGIPGSTVPTDWAKIDPTFLHRFFVLTRATTTSGTATVTSDIANLFMQFARLREGSTAGETANLATIFQDFTITNLLSPYNLTWPGTTALPSFSTDWGLDPDSLVTPLAPFTLSMAKARTITQWYQDGNGVAQHRDVYPNVSEGEVFFYEFSLTKDRKYALSVSTVPALPAGAQIEVMVNKATDVPILFGPGSAPFTLSLIGNASDTTTPVWHTLRFRVISPTVKQPDLQLTVHLDKVI